MNFFKIFIFLSIFIIFQSLTNPLWAYDQIIRPYQSARSAAMGGVRITTGLYDENFFGNPARVTANPGFRLQLFDLLLESTVDSVGTASRLTRTDDPVLEIAESSGSNIHFRVQTTSPSIFFDSLASKLYFGLGLIMSTQGDIGLRRSFNIEPSALIDVGPAFTIGKKFLNKERLSVGITTHLTYRLASKEAYTLIDLLEGQSLSPAKSGGEGTHLDFDLGSTYDFPFHINNFSFHGGASITNIFDGRYSNINFKPVNLGGLPRQQPRALHLGISGTRKSAGIFNDLILAFEATDIGNNKNGSLFRLLHLGAEAKWKLLHPRLGINQGYLCAGLGIYLGIMEFDFATYGEELSLNAGGKEDRRFVFRFNLFI